MKILCLVQDCWRLGATAIVARGCAAVKKNKIADAISVGEVSLIFIRVDNAVHPVSQGKKSRRPVADLFGQERDASLPR